MGDVFKGWRRKVGIVTLGLACAFAAGWVQSIGRPNQTVFSVAQGRYANLSDQVLHDIRITQDGFEWTTERAGLWKDYKTPLLVPHRSIAIGMTLLSAYLILWPVKPNPKHPRSGQPPNPWRESRSPTI